MWNLAEVTFEDWVSLSRILSGKFRHVGSREWVLLAGVYGPHILGEKGVFLQNLIKLREAYMEDL